MMQIQIASENSFIIYFNDKIDSQTSANIGAFSSLLRASMGPKLIDLIPSYASILVIYDIHQTDHYDVRTIVIDTAAQLSDITQNQGKTIHLPVYYSEESSPDLQRIANNAKLSLEETIQCHSQQAYRVYAIGFAPGFAYLGEVDERIATARISTPRMKVPKGAVAIADRQTAIYPSQSPGGWNLIGLCPTAMFNPQASPPMPVSVGDSIQFHSVSKAEFLAEGGDESLLTESVA